MKNIIDHQIHISTKQFSGKVLILLLHCILMTWIPGLASSANHCPFLGDFECDSDCDTIGSLIDIESFIDEYSPSIFSSCVRVFGTLYINEDTDLSEAELVMEPGAEIVVQTEITLTLNACHLIAGCEILWRGIRLEDEAHLKIYNTTISGANAAIYLGNECSLRAWYSIFENNYIGIATAMPYDMS